MRPLAGILAVMLLFFSMQPVALEQRDVKVMSVAEMAQYFAKASSAYSPNLVGSSPSSGVSSGPSAGADAETIASVPLSSSGKSILNNDGIAKPASSACMAAGNRLKEKVSYFVSQNGLNRGYDQRQVAAVIYALIFTEDKCEKQGKSGYLNLGCGLSKYEKTVDRQLDCATQTIYNWLDRPKCSGNLICALQTYSPEIQHADGSWENRQGLYNERLQIARSMLGEDLLA